MGFGDYLPNENVGIPRFLHIGRNPWLGDYASNDPSAVNSRENTGLSLTSDRIALISHNSTGLYPSNGLFAVISHNPPRFPTISNTPHGKSSQTDPSTDKVPHASPDTSTRTSKRQYAPADTIPRTSPRTLASTSTHLPMPASTARAYIDAADGSESNSARSLAISF